MSNSNNFKGFYGTLKGIVTRDDDPDGNGKIQVYIPSYHGELDENKKGSGTSYGSYPWAQVCSVNMKTTSSKNNGLFSSLWSSITGSSSSSSIAESGVIYPGIGDAVWLTFEGGDIRCPVFQGVMYNAQQSEYSNGLSDNVAGGSLANIAASIIYSEEGTYDSINGNDNGAISIGRIQWHAGRAQSLLKQIRAANVEQFDNTADSKGASALITDLNMSSWNSYIVSSGSAKYNAIKSVLGTSESKKLQDELMISDINGYIEYGRKNGVTDNAALVYFADLCNQFGNSGALKFVKAASKPVTLDSLHNAALNKYTSRRIRVYNKIKELDSAGKLTTADQTVNIEGANLGGTYLWPVPSSTYISSYYGPRKLAGINSTYHYGIDIAGGVDGKPAIAVDNGTVAKITHNYNKSLGEGNAIFIQLDKNKNHYAVYFHGKYPHEQNPGLKVGDRVKAGQTVHIIGTTGSSTGPHLHFGIHVGSPWGTRSTSGRIDPLPLLKG